MSVCKMFTVKASNNNRLSFNEFSMSGSTYEPKGTLYDGEGNATAGVDQPSLAEVATVCAMCNDSAVDYNSAKGIYEKVGEATETALTVLVEKLNCAGLNLASKSNSERCSAVNQTVKAKWAKEHTLEFSRDRKSMSAYCRSKETGEAKLFVKGAAEAVLERCTHAMCGDEKIPLTNSMKKQMEGLIFEYGTGRDTLRCLTMAVCDHQMSPDDMDLAESSKFIHYEKNLT